MDHDLYIEADGTVSHVYDDELAGLLTADAAAETTRRASHVEPAHAWCPHCGQVYGHAAGCAYTDFRTLGTDGWVADMSPVGGPVLLDGGVPFLTRAAALTAERLWLAEQLERRRLEPA